MAKKKKLSVKQRRFQSLLRARPENTARDLNPKSLLDHQIESIESGMSKKSLEVLSRGQKRRLEKRIGKFASKRSLEEKGRKVEEEIAQLRR